MRTKLFGPSRRFGFFRLLSVAFALALLAVPPARADAPVKVNFRLDWSIYGAHAPFFLGVEKGFFAKEGIDLNIEEGQGSGTVMQLIAQGGDPVGLVDYSSFINGVEQGMPIKAVMRISSDLLCIISHADTAIHTPKDLVGKIVAFAPAESSGLALPALLLAQGVDPKSVSILNPAFGAKNALFLQNRADAIPANTNVQPAQLEAQGAKLFVFKYSDFGVSMMAQGIVVNEAFLAKNPDLVRHFLIAVRQSYEAAQKDPGAAVDAIVKALPEQRRNRDVLVKQLDATLPSLTTKYTQDKPFGYMDARDWNDTESLMLKYIGLKKPVPVETLYSNAYLPQ